MTNNKSCQKDNFGWATYQKAARRLSGAQMDALQSGLLRPLLDFARDDPEVRFEVRPAAANLYYRGGSLVKLQGRAPDGLKSVFDMRYVDGLQPESRPLWTGGDVKQLAGSLPERKQQMRVHGDISTGHKELRLEQRIVSANDGRRLSEMGEFVVFDMEYSYARRRFDFVALETSELPRPRLIFAELKCDCGALGGPAGLMRHGRDFRTLVVGEGSSHLDRIRAELAGLIGQKKDLRLLAPDLPFEGFSALPPIFLVVLASLKVEEPRLEKPIAALREELAGEPSLLDRARFVDLGDADEADADLRLRRDTLKGFAAFDVYRRRPA